MQTSKGSCSLSMVQSCCWEVIAKPEIILFNPLAFILFGSCYSLMANMSRSDMHQFQTKKSNIWQTSIIPSLSTALEAQ